MLCFVVGCNHQSFRETCKFFRFPKHLLRQWEKLCRRKDRRVTDADRICSCHCKDGLKENGPTLFPWNQGTYFDFQDPNSISKKSKKEPPIENNCLESADTEMSITAPPNTSFTDISNQRSGACGDHKYMRSYSSLLQEINDLKVQIADSEAEIVSLKAKKHPFSIEQILDCEKKMLMYTSLKADMFAVIDTTLQRFPLTYVDGWTPATFSRTDQLLMTMMKLKLNPPLLDIAERFCTSKATVHYHTYLCFCMRYFLREAKEMRKAKHATIQGPSSHYVDIKQEPPGTPTGQVATATAAGPSFQFLQNIKQEPIDSSLLSMQSSSQSSFSPGSSQVSNLSLTQSTSLSNISGSVCGSFDIDEDSQFSHSSSKNDMWLTEHDLKADSSLPNLLMTEDMDNVDSESDLEIDPGMITPPLGSPSNQPDSPTINDLLMSITSTDGNVSFRNSNKHIRFRSNFTQIFHQVPSFRSN
ncbi:uncharacterized protein [Argopecten irradians]|uniref:uncharacterized protein n=1 Tax=Argopecten irradians TaxID=31199 RepID=UPI00371766F8